MKTAIISVGILLATFPLHAQESIPLPTISTRGTAHVYVEPDEVIVSVHLDNEDNNLQEAARMTDSQAKSVLKTCLEFGIKPEHAQSTRRDYGRNYKYKEGRPKYRASQQITICLKDLSKYDAFMQSILSIDVANVSGVQFRTTKHHEKMDEARVKAVIAAKEKAMLMATELGQKVGRAMHVNEDNALGGWRGQTAYANTVSPMASGSSENDGSAFAPGQLKIEASVNVTFSLE